MPEIHQTFTWFVDDGVLHVQKAQGRLAARVYRAVFFGVSISAGIIVTGLVAWLIHTLLSDARPAGDAVVIVALVLGVLLVFSPDHP